MKKITRKKHLEMKLQSIPSHPNPKVGLEQYATPSVIASDLVWNAHSLGDIENKNILDLGCGTGIFTIASALMGANLACGVDVDDESIRLARQVSDNLDLGNADYILSDVCDLNVGFEVDTVIQNPPFGSQRRAKVGQDLNFIKKACMLKPSVLYSFHMASTQEFLLDFYQAEGLEITHLFRYDFPIPKIYDFHTKEKQNVNVIVIRALLDF
ncbi:MAG: methyltransferase [Methanobrevibacter sp.]|nr:methyltransferase [Methanobrevibacter sp.]